MSFLSYPHVVSGYPEALEKPGFRVKPGMTKYEILDYDTASKSGNNNECFYHK
jgi:hypothetical protein